MRHVSVTLCLALLFATGVQALHVRDVEGVTYQIEPGAVWVVDRGTGRFLDLPAFARPSFMLRDDGMVTAAIQTAAGIQVIFLDPVREACTVLRTLRGAAEPQLTAAGLFYTIDNGTQERLCFRDDSGRTTVVARFPEIGGYAAVEYDGRIAVAVGAARAQHERIYLTRWDGRTWSAPVAITPAGCVRFSPEISRDSAGRLIIASLGIEPGGNRLYVAVESAQGFQERVVSPTGESASGHRFSEALNGRLFWISSGSQGDRIVGIGLEDDQPRVVASCSPTTVLAKVGGRLFSGPRRPLDDVDLSRCSRYRPADLPEQPPVSRLLADADHYVGFGDSIMEGNSPDNGASEDSAFYPYLKSELMNTYGNAVVFNEGSGGENTARGIKRIDNVLAADAPGFICIMEGTNDITRRRDHYTATTTTRNLMRMADKCLSAGAVPILSTLIPRTHEDPYDPNNTQTRRWNRTILNEGRRKSVTTVDLFNTFYRTPGWQTTLMGDRIHPGPAGFQLMGEVWLKAIKDLKGPPVCDPPTIITHPAAQTIVSGETATLTVAVTGTAPFSYQWYQGVTGDTSVPVGTDSDTFTTPALAADTAYWVRVTNAYGQADSFPALITVTPACVGASILTPPQSQTIASGLTATLTVTAAGTAPFNYQWYQGVSGDTSTPVGTSSDAFTTPALTTDTSYWVRVTNTCGQADSATATITVTP